MEDPEWFTRSHEEIARWFDEELVDGLRIDHPDGLRDPGRYLDDLAGLTGGAYVLVEKILEPGERLPASWATAGTTGYDALALIDRVLTDPAGGVPLGELEDRLRGGPVDWHAMIHGTKRGIADTTLLAETRRIARELAALVERVVGGARGRGRRAAGLHARLPLLPARGPRAPRRRLLRRPRAPPRPRRRPRRGGARCSATVLRTRPSGSSRPAAW